MQKNLCRILPCAAALALALHAPAQDHWWVSPTGDDGNAGSEASPFQTIMHAATVAASGDVIHLFAATYGDEQGIVLLGSKDLSLIGAGVGQTILKAHSTLDTTLPAGTLATPSNEAHRCALALQGSGNIYVRDLTLDQGFSVPSTGRAYSLWVGGGADAVLDHVECVNARANPINGIQSPLGVNVRGDGGADLTNVTLRGCLVHEYGKGGIAVNYDAHLSMDDCIVRGNPHADVPLAAQNGVQISRGATAEVRRTTVLNHWYDPASYTATGMLIFDAGAGIVIEDCSLGGNESGIYFYSSTASAIPATVRRNVVHCSQFAWVNFGATGLDVRENVFAITEAGVNNDAYDTAAAGNTYDGNWYSSQDMPGVYAIPGGASVDNNAKPFANGYGASVATALPAGHAPIDIVLADLGGDSAKDFAALCQGASPALAVGLNTAGTFGVVSVPFGNSMGDPVAVVAGEFDGAPGLDLAALTVNVPPATAENKVYVFGNDGSGAFSLLAVHALGGTAASGIAAGDVSGDGIDDLVVTDAGSAGLTPGAATVLVNDGTGLVMTPTALAGGFAVACRAAAIADVDEDTIADVVVVEGDAVTGLVHVLLGDGVGGYAPAAGSPLACSSNPNRVIVADVEGDGDPDVLVSASVDAFGLTEGAVDVFGNEAGELLRIVYKVDHGPAALVIGDLDDDDDPDTVRRDVAVVNRTASTISVLGSWTGYGPARGGVVAAGTTLSGVGLADVDGDGFGDVVYCDAAAGEVVVLAGVPTARADNYGRGTAGTRGLLANLYPVGAPAVPTVGNATFGFGLRNVRPFSIAVIAAGLNPAPITPGGILVTDLGATWAAVTNFQGRAAVPLPIPPTPALAGVAVYGQAGVFDPAGNETVLDGLVVSNGLKVRIGN